MKQSNTQERWNLHGLLFRPISMDSVEEKVLLGKIWRLQECHTRLSQNPN